ncbi:hypothetical protein [Streptomyces sp. NPDC051001]|uniref:hypothetical protein n=1 Tax=Streptomyces sp. NPDC051001 TaxID=3155795 RepID=UPI00342F5AD2
MGEGRHLHPRQVGGLEAFATARVPVRHSGLIIGGSAGGVMHQALTRMASLAPGTTMVALLNRVARGT